MTLRSILLVGHRWLGVVTSVALALTGASGALLIWTMPFPVRAIAGPMHEMFMMGRIGARIVLAVTLVAIVLQVTGLVLWWKCKTVVVRRSVTLRAAVVDLHHAVGIVCLPLMLLLSITGVGMATGHTFGRDVEHVIETYHTGRTLPLPVQIVYVLGALSFLVQGVTGVFMWWKRPRTGGAFVRSAG